MVFKTMFLHLLLKQSLVLVSSTGEESSAFICVWCTNHLIDASQTSPSSCIRVLASIARAKLPTNPWLCRLCEGRPLLLAQILLLSQAAWVHWIPTEMTCSTRSPWKCPIMYLVWLLKRGKFYWLSYSGAFWLNTSWITPQISTSLISFPPLQTFWLICFCRWDILARWVTFHLRSNTSTAPCKAGVFSSCEISDGYTIFGTGPVQLSTQFSCSCI